MFQDKHLQRRIAIIGAPLCDGERELGVETAPRVIREAGLLAAFRSGSFRDLGDIASDTPIPDIISGRVRNTEHVVKGAEELGRLWPTQLGKGIFHS
jgi:arginase family enzyme